MAFCGGCGAGLRDGARFCATCGQPTSTPSGKTIPSKVPVAVRPVGPAAPSPVAAPAPAKNRTPVVVAVLGVLAVVIGVTVGLVITSGGDETEAADASDSTNGGSSNGDDSSEDDGGDTSDDGGGSDPEPTFTDDVSFSLNSDNNTFAPDELIVLTPDYGSGSGIEHVELFVDGEQEGLFDPGEEISTSLPAGNHRLRLIVEPIEGAQVRSDLQRIVVEEPVLGNPVQPALLSVANEYSNALQNNNWTRVVEMNASKAGVDFEAEWGDIDRQFVVPVYATGNVLRLGLVVNQFYNIDIPGSGPRTSLYCNTWTINTSARTLTATAGFQPDFRQYPPDTDPFDVQAEILENC